MITHIVLFKLKERSKEYIREALGLLEGLEGKIASLRGITVGEDVSQAGRSYDVGIIARFENLDGLESYRVDPAHVVVAKRLNEICSSIVALDFEEKCIE